MGNDVRHKGILLDEADFALPRDCDESMLVEAVLDYCEAEFTNEFGCPFLEIIGVVAEGFEETAAYPFDPTRAVWVKPGMGFRDIFLGLATELGIPAPLAAEAMMTGHAQNIEMHLEDRIRKHIDDRDFDDARDLLVCKSALSSDGLVGLGAGAFDTLGQAMIEDYRINNYGPGRRILVEIEFDWGE